MKMGKVFCFVLSLAVGLPGPLVDHAWSQEGEIPALAVEREEEGNPQLAAIVTAMNIPARGILCGLTGWMASITMFISGGMRYTTAAQMMEEGCSGPWVITPEMLHEGRLTGKEVSGVVSSEEKQP